MNNSHGLETTLERVGRILSHRYDITVRCRANECKTDGRTIWLPALPDPLSPSLWTLIRGELDHETAHILFSDFEGRMKTFRETWGDFGFDLLNVIEDVRVNDAMQREYPGSRQNILQSIEEIISSHPIDQMGLPVRFLCGLFLAGMDMPYGQYGQDAAHIVAPFLAEARKFKSLRSTDEACLMAENILQRIQNPADNLQPQAQSSPSSAEEGSANGNMPGDDLQSNASQSANAHHEMNEDEDKSIEEKEGNLSKEERESKQKQASLESGKGDSSSASLPAGSEPSDSSQPQEKKKLEEALQAISSSSGNPFDLQRIIQSQMQTEGKQDSQMPYRVFDPSLDRLVTPKTSDDGTVYRTLSQLVMPHVATLRQQLIRTLRAREARFWVGEQEEGHIDSRRLYTLFHQTTNKVFRQKQSCQSDSVCVSLLIDASGSMSGSRIHLTRQTAVLFAETLHPLRIPFEVISFTTANTKRVYRHLETACGMTSDQVAPHFARYFPCIYTLFKAFDEPLKAMKPRMPAMAALEYTPINDAILFAGKRILARKETRKILLILTDGEPYSGNPAHLATVYRHLREVLRTCKDAGIECVAIGIQTDYVNQFFAEYLVVNEVADLPKAFFVKFADLLRRNPSQ